MRPAWMVFVIAVLGFGASGAWLTSRAASAAQPAGQVGSVEIETSSLAYRDGDVELEGYVAYPKTLTGKAPAVLVVHEWWGLNDFARRKARELAELGYVGVAIDMYGKGVVTTAPEEAGKLAGKVSGDANVLRARAKAGLEAARRHSKVDAERIAAIGFCFGGSTVLQMAHADMGLQGVVGFHGSPVPPLESDPKESMTAILVLHGADDPLVPDEQIDAFVKAMRGRKVDWQMIFYGGAVHGFTNPGADKVGIKGVAYNAAADRRSWEHMKDFLAERLRSQR